MKSLITFFNAATWSLVVFTSGLAAGAGAALVAFFLSSFH
jgi:hypothetical protein